MGVDWKVGSKQVVEAGYKLDGAYDLTGSVSVRFKRLSGSTVEFLQSDLQTFSSTDYAHPLVLTGNKWKFTITIPSTMMDYTITEEVTHSDAGYVVQSEEHDVYNASVDDIIDAVPTGKFGFL